MVLRRGRLSRLRPRRLTRRAPETPVTGTRPATTAPDTLALHLAKIRALVEMAESRGQQAGDVLQLAQALRPSIDVLVRHHADRLAEAGLTT